MTESRTLEFETAHFAQSLFADDEANLRYLERQTGVRVTTRDGWLRLEGDPAAVEHACRVFGELEGVRRSGAEISEEAFRFAVDSAGRKPRPGETLADLFSARLLGSPRRPPVVPRTLGQLRYLKLIDSQPVVFGTGPAGTGKTYLAVAKALVALKEKRVNRIVLSRPAVEAGEALGFLPGALEEKISPYLRPLYDAIYDMLEPSEVEKLIERGAIEIAPLAYMRGRTLHRSFIILDEAQNTTEEQMFMLLTRLGEAARCVVTGDPSQVDLRPRVGSGLREALRLLRGVEGVGFAEFGTADVVRHRVVQRIIEAYEDGRREPGGGGGGKTG
jgi:phosphate starvation-inducible PhoH-like protein